MLNQIRGPSLSKLKVRRRKLVKYDSSTVHICTGFDFLIIFYLGKDYFDHQPSWFDTLSKNARCLEVENVPVRAKDLEAMKKGL